MEEENKNDLRKIVRESHLDFLYDLLGQGVDIGDDNFNHLKKNGYITEATRVQGKTLDESGINFHALSLKNEKSDEVNKFVDIVESDTVNEKNFDVITSFDLEERRKKHKHKFEGRKTPILRHEWLPESTTDHKPEFVDWIKSINSKKFMNKIYYRPFALYCQQAYQWLEDTSDYTDFEDEELREEWRQNELRKCSENSLYWLNKYVWYKEGDAEIGKVKYIAAPVHEFLAYMEDCGYSMGIAKGRQIAATTTLMALDVHDVIFKQNHFMKFITEDVDKAQEIIEDKLKFAFSELPEWMRPDVLNERDNMFKMGYKVEKGRKEGVGSKIQVAAPKRTAIAGGAPQKVKIDEAGNIPILGQMINNARPTMLYFNKTTGKLVLKRRLVYWGTGGQMEKGGKAFETELMALMKEWDDNKFSSGVVPIFFDWTCRPGATQEDYDRERAIAYAKGNNDQDPKAKDAITEFHWTWPNSLSDVFKTASKTLVDEEFIERQLKRIQEAKEKHGHEIHQSGYFEPVYDLGSPAQEGSDVPYKIIGATFIPTEDIDRRASVVIFMHPKKGWTKRYYQGTDPIDTYTGNSNFASTVWDKHYKTPAAILNWRIPDYQQVFLQATLMSLYYDHAEEKTGIKELIESNRGTSYYEYRKAKGLDKNLVLNYQLPATLQNKTTVNDGVGIDNKGLRSTMIVNRMFEMFKFYGENFYHSVPFEQLKTFTCQTSENGKDMWGPINRRYFMDDTLYSSTFAYICAELCFQDIEPQNEESMKAKTTMEYKLVRDTNGRLRRAPVKKTTYERRL